MNKKLNDFVYTFSANILNFIMGFVTGFIIPKFMGIDDYAYLKLFTFYATYVGLTHFGFLDGIYIKFGKYDYGDLPKEKFRGYFKVLIIMQIIEAIILSGILFLTTRDMNRIIVYFFVILNMIILNITSLFTFIHQITKRFKLLSINIILSKFLYVIGCVGLILINITQFIPFIILQTIVNIIILCVYIYKNKVLVWGESEKLSDNFKDYLNLTKIGFFIMIGNFITILVLGIDRIFVDKLFSLEDFAMYSFAYTLISLFYILSNSLSMVIYPYLTRMKKENYKQSYETLRVFISILMGITLTGYFFLEIIIKGFLPQYINSFSILIFLVPTVIYSAQINILIANYYKILKHTKEYTKNNIIALILSVITNLVACIIYKDIKAIACATLISFILWLLYSDVYFIKSIKVNVVKAYIVDVFIIILFFICASMFKWYIGMLIYITIFACFILIFLKKDILELINITKTNN